MVSPMPMMVRVEPVTPEPALFKTVVTPLSVDNSACGLRQCPGLGGTSLASDTLRVCASSVSQPCHGFAEPRGYRRSQEDTKTSQLKYGRNHVDTTGQERTRHYRGSGP